MSTASASQYSLIGPSANIVKRKRGQPRKDEVSGSDPRRRNQQHRVLPISSSDHDFVGQEVSGVLDGVFDAGYLLTVKVDGTGPIMRGMVFDPRLSIPITAENDLAPHLSMRRRDGIPNPITENFTNQHALSSLGYMMQKANDMQNSSPSSMKEVTPNSLGPQTVGQTIEHKIISNNVGVETLISGGPSDFYAAPNNVCKPSYGSKTSFASKLLSLDLSCPLVPKHSDVPGVVTAEFSENEPTINVSMLAISKEDIDPKEATSIVSNPLDVSRDVLVFSEKIIADATEVWQSGKTVGSMAKENKSSQRLEEPFPNTKDNERSLDIIKEPASEGEMAGCMGNAKRPQTLTFQS